MQNNSPERALTTSPCRWMSHRDATKRCHCKLGQHPPPPSPNIDVVHYEIHPSCTSRAPAFHQATFSMCTFSFCVNKGGILTQCVVDAEADLAVYGNGANITHPNAPLFRSLLTFRSGGGIKGGKPVCSLVESLCNTEKRCHKPAPTSVHN